MQAPSLPGLDVGEARTYAWNYFALHADQRLKMFSFFLVLSGLILGTFSAVQGMAQGSRMVILLPALLILTAIVFWRLEERTRGLVKNAEEALRFLDSHSMPEGRSDEIPHCLRLFASDDYRMASVNSRWWAKRIIPISYADSFRIAYLMIGGIGLVLATWVAMN